MKPQASKQNQIQKVLSAPTRVPIISLRLEHIHSVQGERYLAHKFHLPPSSMSTLKRLIKRTKNKWGAVSGFDFDFFRYLGYQLEVDVSLKLPEEDKARFISRFPYLRILITDDNIINLYEL